MRRHDLSALARRHGLRAIILFGSRARGDAQAGSDCDICVSARRLPIDEVRLINDLSRALSQDVDLSVLERVGPSLGWTVATEGKLLWGSREDWDRLRLRAIREWQDCEKWVAATRAYLERTLG